MHPARRFHVSDPAILRQRILEYPFAVISAVSDGQPIAAHAPVLPSGEGETLSLRFHLSVANAVTKALLAGSPALAVFTGPHAYVSPDWYGIEDQVPTWNYISVEASGPVTRLDDAAMRQLIDDISDHFEAGLAPKPVWKTAKMTPARLEALYRGLVAFELRPERFEGIAKLNQDKPASARASVIEALDATESGFALAAEMRKLEP
ncbi:FMN-binding negative transcriptional regulator [Hyphomonas jannaschiana]|uniref:Putative FMN-binding protein n=1 Tax=Hyphomonas jannaschiana VP2 TaxID=1280952 RepID=A0A059FHP5_9PROT|nr:FMN-binding negative transcriptional regulator [Hyphomonas jannaschiana]KCZ90169.1 putative FMN-binding protein [Hyphomonas jannaschiana VP2]